MERTSRGRRSATGEAVLADLLHLPAARIFPPLLGSKRGRKADAAGPHDEGAAKPAGIAHLQLASDMQLRSKGTGLLRDPTSLLLAEAASQLNDLVHAQLTRRMLKAARRGGTAAAALSESDSEAEDVDACDSGCAADCACAAALSPSSLQPAADSASASVSASASASLDSSLPESAGPVSLSRIKRIRLERQYAIDLGGLCMMGAQRQPLPDAEELASLVR